MSAYPAAYGGPWLGSGWASEVDVRQYVEGTLVIDVFDARTRRAVWHGSARKELSMAEIDHSETPIREAVADVLAGFPPQHAGATHLMPPKHPCRLGRASWPPLERPVAT